MISQDRIDRIEAALIANGNDLTIHWGDAFKSKSSDRDYTVHIVCNKDGVKTTRGVSTLAKGAFYCEECTITKYKEKLGRFDFTFVRKEVNNRISTIVFTCKHCSTERRLSCGNLMHMNEIKCHNCRSTKIVSILDSKGCKFISRKPFNAKNNSGATITYNDTNNNVRTVSETSILRRSFASSDSHWEQQHYVYLFISKDEDHPYFKIGTANVPEQRLKDLKLEFECNIMRSCFCSRYEADKQEKLLHKMCNEFSLSKSIAEDFTSGLSRRLKTGNRIKMGCTEWFKIEAMPLVINNFSN